MGAYQHVATDALVLKHQAISIHSVDYAFTVLELHWIHRLRTTLPRGLNAMD